MPTATRTLALAALVTDYFRKPLPEISLSLWTLALSVYVPLNPCTSHWHSPRGLKTCLASGRGGNPFRAFPATHKADPDRYVSLLANLENRSSTPVLGVR